MENFTQTAWFRLLCAMATYWLAGVIGGFALPDDMKAEVQNLLPQWVEVLLAGVLVLAAVLYGRLKHNQNADVNQFEGAANASLVSAARKRPSRGGLDRDTLTFFLLAPLLAAALCTGGCMGGHDFAMKGATSMAAAVTEVEGGTEEYHVAAVTDFDNAQASQTAGLAQTLANYVAKVASDPALKGKTITPEMAKQALKPELDKYAKQVLDLTFERKNELERYTKLLSNLQWMRDLAAQMADMEQRRYATVDELKANASKYVQAAIAKRSTGP